MFIYIDLIVLILLELFVYIYGFQKLLLIVSEFFLEIRNII